MGLRLDLQELGLPRVVKELAALLLNEFDQPSPLKEVMPL